MSLALSPCWTSSRQLPDVKPNFQPFKSTDLSQFFPSSFHFYSSQDGLFCTVSNSDPSVSSIISLIKLKINLFITLPWYSSRGFPIHFYTREGGNRLRACITVTPVRQHSSLVNKPHQVFLSPFVVLFFLLHLGQCCLQTA